MAVGALLLPINAAQRLELLAGDYLQADETPVGVQSPDAPKGQNHRAWQWQYSVPGGPVVFDFQMSRSRAGPAAFLQNYRGVVQTDAYGAYDSVMGPGMIHAGCWAHARRKFHEAHQGDPADAPAREVLERIRRLYAVEAQARAEKLTAVARQQRRQEQSAAEVSALKARLLTIRAEILPGSQLATGGFRRESLANNRQKFCRRERLRQIVCALTKIQTAPRNLARIATHINHPKRRFGGKKLIR